MIANAPTMTIPLRTDERGTIYISNTRVTLDSIIQFYLQGESPEALQQGFPTISLPDVYAVIAYYLAHHAEVDEYLKRRNEDAKRIRQEIEAICPPKITRAKLQARRDAKRGKADTD